MNKQASAIVNSRVNSRVDSQADAPENSPAAILSAWTAIEVLSPPSFREPEDLTGGDREAIARLDGEHLPWEEGREEPRPNKRLYYQVILGTIDLEAATRRLVATYGDSRVERGRNKGEAIMAVLLLNSAGVPVRENAASIASYAWGVPLALKGQLQLLKDWTVVEEKLIEGLDKQIRRTDDDGQPLPLTAKHIKKAVAWLVSTLTLPADLVKPPRYAIRTYGHFSNPNPPEALLLNSFFLNYLQIAGKQVAHDAAPTNLKLFLGLTPPTVRRDLLNDKESLMSAVRPKMFSPGRWPAPGRHPLVLLQQAAVNLALAELKDGGILAVNGPPGTGKTTLLRDIVAALVTERARAMAEFADPAQAFEESGQRLDVGSGWFNLYKLDARLRGFEMVVVSSNNKAVENVSAELPGSSAIAEDAQGTLRYFATLSNALLQRETWGLIAAVLGNLSNRERFKKSFWWDKDVGLGVYLLAASGTPQTIRTVDRNGEKTERPPTIVVNEQAPADRNEALERWAQARQAFRTALGESEKRLKELEAVRLFAESGGDLTAVKKALKFAQTKHDLHQSSRPDWRARLFRTAAFREWRKADRAAKKSVTDAQEKLRELQTDIAGMHKTLQQMAQGRGIEDAVRATRQKLGTRFVDAQFFTRNRTDYQQESPWLDDAAHRLRDNVFISAMALHKAFIDAAAKPLRHNLGVLMNTFGTPVPFTDAAKETLLPHLWTSLFLVVPVISTTFASVERMLGRLPEEALGWLLIDEAGQAAPQAAVGALTRTRRTVVVGDPMQIEPVVTLSNKLTEAICRHCGVDPDKYNAPTASVQTLADAATPCVAQFEGHNGNRTVGIPLLIHRRCAEPMFGISNTVAYDRLMINAKKHRPSTIRGVLGASHWFDIQGDSNGKWCPQEGQFVIGLLKKLAQAGALPDLYIVTPFVDVQQGLREIVKHSRILEHWIPGARAWPYERIGTVHVVQGREAEAVIFVLGAQSPEQAGARSWAGGRPNLLNVAVSRAREVLYIVGNRSLWRTAGVFRELDARMPQV